MRQPKNKNSIKIDIPGTLIFSFEGRIPYLFTNEHGYLSMITLNEESSGCTHSEEQIVSGNAEQQSF